MPAFPTAKILALRLAVIQFFGEAQVTLSGVNFVTPLKLASSDGVRPNNKNMAYHLGHVDHIEGTT